MDSTACIVIRSFKKVTKGGDPYLEFKLKDDLGKIFYAKRWQANEEELKIREGDILCVAGPEDQWNGNKYINVRELLVDKEGTIDRKVFLRGLDSEVKSKYVRRFNDLIALVVNEGYRQLLEVVFNDSFRENEFYLFPAGLEKHHSEFGGLLQHSVEVAELCRAIAISLKEEHPGLDIDLLITAALLHDIGKTKTYDITRGVTEIRDIEYMVGHAVYSIETVSTCERMLKKDFKLVKHLLASHQGKREHHAVAVPCTKEALILARADEFSSQLAVFDNLEYDESGKAWHVGEHTYIWKGISKVDNIPITGTVPI